LEALQINPGAQFKFFLSHAAKPPQPKRIKHLILMLLASKILSHKIVFEVAGTDKKTPVFLARLNFDSNMELCLNDDAYWAHLPLRE
jgi:hypothetical protein